jgi:putative peptide zinc metalloprotease protein
LAKLEDGGAPPPTAQEALLTFLGQLDSAGILEGAEDAPASKKGRRVLDVNLDSAAQRCARLLSGVPPVVRRAFLWTSLCLAFVAVCFTLDAAGRPRLANFVGQVTLPGLAAIVLFVIPAHEFGHAVASRLSGIPAFARVELGRLSFPKIYVSTPGAWSAPWQVRFFISGAGPASDLILCGVAGGLFLAVPEGGVLGRSCALVFFFTLLSLAYGTCPLLDGDGSHMLQALLDDDRVRLVALHRAKTRFTRPWQVWTYRCSAVVHLAAWSSVWSRLAP